MLDKDIIKKLVDLNFTKLSRSYIYKDVLIINNFYLEDKNLLIKFLGKKVFEKDIALEKRIFINYLLNNLFN